MGRDARSVEVTGLTNGTPYTIEVRATSAAGPGAVGTGGPVTPVEVPATAPGAPTGVSATALDASARVSWTAPTSTGGAPISGYTVTSSDGQTATVAGTARQAVVSGLTNGTPYTFTVAASNSAGAGPASASSNEVTPTAAPAAPATPTGVAATAGVRSANVTWNASAGATGYDLQVFRGTGTTPIRTVAVTGNSTSITGLANNTTYRFAVRSRNAGAVSAYSARAAAVTTHALPGAPGIGAASSGAAGGAITATARWTAPLSDGRSPVTGYVVQAQRFATTTSTAPLATVTSAPQSATSSTLTMTLPRTGIWRFSVKARNAVGDGAYSPRSGAVTAR